MIMLLFSEVFEKCDDWKSCQREFRVVRNGEKPAPSLGINGLDG